jgi:hypothetical protein
VEPDPQVAVAVAAPGRVSLSPQSTVAPGGSGWPEQLTGPHRGIIPGANP